MSLRLASFEIENLRGFQRASISLERWSTVLVGGNNSGKTSVLLLLDWLLNQLDAELAFGGRGLTAEECRVLIPARSTGNRARRLTLRVRVMDGRQRRRFRCEGDVAILRLDQRQHPSPHVRLRLGRARRGEKFEAHEIAWALLQQLRRETAFLHVPASRDAASSRFESTMITALTERLAQRAVHETQGGAPSEYREINKALRTIARVSKRLADPLWDDMAQEIVPGLSRAASFALDASARDLVEWVAQRMRFALSTGEHDIQMVAPTEVGSGLQSLLDLAMLKGGAEAKGRDAILAVEEPEAFLHPSAQRALARRLFHETSARILLSTHSPLVVEEARFSDIVLVRDHRVFEPREVDEERDAINTALLTGLGAEMAFAESVLVVEGEGDRQFFDGLRRRVSEQDEIGFAHRCFAVTSGSNSSFAPWMRMLSTYGDESYRPIEWLIVADGDSTAALRSAFTAAGMPLSLDSREAMRSLAAAFRMDDRDGAIGAAQQFNRNALKSGERAILLPVDLEWCALSGASEDTAEKLAAQFGGASQSGEQLAAYLGSKCTNLSISRKGKKAPWMRAILAAELPWGEVSDDAKAVLRRWLMGAASRREVDGLLGRMK